MMFVFVCVVVLLSTAIALYCFLRKVELEQTITALEKEWEAREAGHAAELEKFRVKLAKLERIQHIPDVIDRAKRTELETETKLRNAQEQAERILLEATLKAQQMEKDALAGLEQAQRDGEDLKQRLISGAGAAATKAREALRVAELQAADIIEQAQKAARQSASQARKEAKERIQKAEDTLNLATTYALETRQKAENRAVEIAGKAYDALRRREHHEAAAKAMENVLSGYAGTYVIPASHILDELADDFGFHHAGQKLKLARERTRIMENNGTAATCNYPEGWKRDYAIGFVLSAFNGKVDSILARTKPANHGKLAQEIRDTYALVNHNGEVFRQARIQEEFLDARLEELKWGVAVQRLKERVREEQRAIREQMRDEERARKEYERAIKQAQRDEDLLSKALEKARQEFEAAAVEDRTKYEARLREIADKLKEAEEKNQRAISMAQQTKCGHVYVISNIGSFGEDVYKVGLTRRLEPLDRVRELGDASVPFPFDVHALIYSEDAPALEAALHRRFVQCQVNKINRRKEFFRLKLHDIRSVVDEFKHEVKWTLTAEARDYRDTLAMERQMQDDPAFRKQWADAQLACEAPSLFDEEGDEEHGECEQVASVEEG